eukprot:1149683-Pelagomonas_calceolata.AAC.2
MTAHALHPSNLRHRDLHMLLTLRPSAIMTALAVLHALLSSGIMTDGAGVPTGTPLPDPPLIEAIAEDPVLRDTKLIAEAWDCDGLNQVMLCAVPHGTSVCRGPRAGRHRTDFYTSLDQEQLCTIDLALWVHCFQRSGGKMEGRREVH